MCDARYNEGAVLWWLLEGEKALTYSICQFPWCKYTHCCQFQATSSMSGIYKNPENLATGSQKPEDSIEYLFTHSQKNNNNNWVTLCTSFCSTDLCNNTDLYLYKYFSVLMISVIIKLCKCSSFILIFQNYGYSRFFQLSYKFNKLSISSKCFLEFQQRLH